jgi:hypothetical protein
VSLLSAAPVRFSKPANESAPRLPPPEPVIVQTVSAVGPWSVSVPAPASKATGKPADPS